MKSYRLAAGLAFGLALAAGAASAGAKRPADPSRNVPAARATGPAQSCIRLTEITNSEVRNDWTIDFEAGGRRIYRTILDHRCPGLNAARSFSYKTSLSELCSTDIIYPLHQTGGNLNRGPGCGLGRFTPMELLRTERRRR